MAIAIQHEIPKFLGDQIVYCDKLVLRQKQHFYLLLTRNLKLYEMQRKQLIHSVDLSTTCLHKVAPQISAYQGPRGKWLEAAIPTAEGCLESNAYAGLMETSQLRNTQVDNATRIHAIENAQITFGKYVYRHFEVCKLYVLVRCWDKLVVLQRSNTNLEGTTSYSIVAEYEQVNDFRVARGKLKFQAAIEIRFENTTSTCTDFQCESEDEEKSDNIQEQQSSLQQSLLERLRCAKAELQLHKTATQKQFHRLQNVQTFGCNFLRSLNMEDKSLLTRCGDIWLRFTPVDTLVIGIPLVNSCAPPNLTMLRQIKPILKLNDNRAASLKYRYCLYQLQQTFEHLECLETFFQCADTTMELQTLQAWVVSEKETMQPGDFSVLLIELEIEEIITLRECPLLLRFEVLKKLAYKDDSNAKTHNYEQHLFLKSLDFEAIFIFRESYEICFKETTLHQDFLALAISTHETQLNIRFTTQQDAEKFEHLLVKKFDFALVNRERDFAKTEKHKQRPPSICAGIYYNKNAGNMWYGTLALRFNNITEDEVMETWKFYVKNKAKTFLLLKLLFDELILYKCNVEDVECVNANGKLQLVEFQEALKQELLALQALTDCDNEKKRMKLTKILFTSQMCTDFLAIDMK